MGACSGCKRRPPLREHEKQKVVDELFVFNKRRCKIKQASRNNIDETAPMLLASATSERPAFSSDRNSSIPKNNVVNKAEFMPSRRNEKVQFYVDACNLQVKQSLQQPLVNSRISGGSSDEDPTLPRSAEDDVESGFYDGSNDHPHSCSSHGSRTSPGSVICDRTNIPNRKQSADNLHQQMSVKRHNREEDEKRGNYLLYRWPQPETTRQSLDGIKQTNRLSTDPSHLLPSTCLVPSSPPLCNWVEDTLTSQLFSFSELSFRHAPNDVKAFVKSKICKQCDVIVKNGQDVSFSRFAVLDDNDIDSLSASRIFTQFQEFVLAKFTLEIVNGLFFRETQQYPMHKSEYTEMCRFAIHDNVCPVQSVLDYPFRYNVEALKLITAGRIDSTVAVAQSYAM